MYKHASTTYLLAFSDGKLLESSDVVNQQVHEPEIVTEPHQNIQPTRVEGHTPCFFRKLFVQLQVTVCQRKINE